MYVNRMRLLNVKSLHRCIPEDGGSLPEAARRRLVLQGANGSGKTTILECIRLLWEAFGEWIDRPSRPADLLWGRAHRATATERALPLAELAAMELGDFPTPGQSLWIGLGEGAAWETLLRQHPGAKFAAWVRGGSGPDKSRFALPAGDWQTFRQRSMVGTEPQPNIVHFPPDQRMVVVAPEDGARLIDTTQLNWSALYNPALDLDSLLLTVKALRPADYEEALKLVNLALGHHGKRILGFGADGRLDIEGSTGGGSAYHHRTEDLSSGEQQFLLLTVYTIGFLRPGGILLIDDPDLHIHIAMAPQLMETLELVVRERRGQMIVASHSERVWDWFTREEEQIDLSSWRAAHT